MISKAILIGCGVALSCAAASFPANASCPTDIGDLLSGRYEACTRAKAIERQQLKNMVRAIPDFFHTYSLENKMITCTRIYPWAVREMLIDAETDRKLYAVCVGGR